MTIRNWGFAAGLAAALALAGTARAQSPGTSNQAGGTASAGEQRVDKDLKEKIQKIHASNKAEIHMAQMGAEKAESPEVKQFAERLQQDHQQLDERLTRAAQASGIELSGKDYEKHQERAMKDMDKLQRKSGAEFDREFMSHMVKDHEKDLKAVRSASRDAEKGNHAELAAVLSQAERGMQGHKDQAEQLRDSLGRGGSQRAATGGAAGSTGADAGSTGSQTTPSGGAVGTSSDRLGERGGDTGQSRGGEDRGATGYSTGAEAGSTGAAGTTGAQTTPSGGAEGTSSDRVGERGGDTGQSRGAADAGTTGSTGAEAGSTGAAGTTGGQTTPSGGAEGTSSDRVGERGGDTGQSRGDADRQDAERR